MTRPSCLDSVPTWLEDFLRSCPMAAGRASLDGQGCLPDLRTSRRRRAAQGDPLGDAGLWTLPAAKGDENTLSNLRTPCQWEELRLLPAPLALPITRKWTHWSAEVRVSTDCESAAKRIRPTRPPFIGLETVFRADAGLHVFRDHDGTGRLGGPFFAAHGIRECVTIGGSTIWRPCLSWFPTRRAGTGAGRRIAGGARAAMTCSGTQVPRRRNSIFHPSLQNGLLYLARWEKAGISVRDACASLLVHLSRYAPLALVVWSGGKSLQGWFNATEELREFFEYACALGADPRPGRAAN